MTAEGTGAAVAVAMSGGVIFWQDGHIAWAGIHQGAGM
jgi:hypothetical protein